MRELYKILNLGITPLSDMNMPTSVRHTRIDNKNISKELAELLLDVGVIARGSGIFYSKPGFKISIMHVDCHISDPNSDWPSIGKLNFVIGEENTLTFWADVPLMYRRLSHSTATDINQPYQSYKMAWARDVKVFSIGECHLFEAGVPHTVANPTENPKWTISFMLYDSESGKLLTFSEAKTRLIEYVQKD